MPFSNSVLGGNGQLVRKQEQSVNYVTGVSGWIIRQDGTCEFNNGTFRGSLEVGTAPGQRFIVNPGNGDILDVYDSFNNLVAQIISSGTYINYFYQTPSNNILSQHTRYQSLGIAYLSDKDSSLGSITFSDGGTGVAAQPVIAMQVANNAGTHVYRLNLTAGSDNGVNAATLVGNERGLSGSIVQTTGTSQSNLMWSGDTTGTTDANGNLVITHAASFTPNRVFVQVHDTGLLTSSFGVATVVNGSVNSTTFQIHCVGFNGTVRTNASVSVYWMVLG